MSLGACFVSELNYIPPFSCNTHGRSCVVILEIDYAIISHCLLSSVEHETIYRTSTQLGQTCPISPHRRDHLRLYCAKWKGNEAFQKETPPHLIGFHFTSLLLRTQIPNLIQGVLTERSIVSGIAGQVQFVALPSSFQRRLRTLIRLAHCGFDS